MLGAYRCKVNRKFREISFSFKINFLFFRMDQDAEVSAINVAIRVKPVLAEVPIPWQFTESTITQLLIDGDVVSGAGPSFAFDRVFTLENNESIFANAAREVIDACLDGIHGTFTLLLVGTIFAYGQTSAGKTFTMQGTASDPGLIPLAIRYIFDCKQQHGTSTVTKIVASYMEIYNEVITDLVNPENTQLKIHETTMVHAPLTLFSGRNIRRQLDIG